MPIYNVQAPDGKIYKVEAPENANQNDLFGFVQQQIEAQDIRRLQKEYGPGILETFGRGVKRGMGELGSTITDIIPAMAGSALGFDEYAKEQLAEAAQKRREREMAAPSVFQSYKDVEGLGDAAKFAAETIGEQVANIGTSLIPGVGAGALATRAGLGMAGKAAAVNAGTFLGAYAQNAPEVFQNIYQETGQLAPGASALFGAGAAALDSILPASMAKQLSGPVKMGIVEKVLEKSGMDKGLLRSVTASALKGVPTEGLTEGAQEAISIAAEKFVGDNPQIFESKEWNRIMESAVRGAIAGGAFGGVGGGVEAAQAGAQRRAEYADALERRGQRQLAAEVRRQSADIDQIAAQEPQLQLPGFELGAATELYQATKPEKPGKAPKEPKATQGEFFTPEGELTPAAEKVAAKDEKAAANIARLQAQRDAAATKEAQAKLKKFLASKQMELPGFDEASVKALNEQAAAQQAAAQESGQGDLFAPATAPTTAQPVTTPVSEPQVRTAPSLETITKIDDLKAFGKLFGIGPTARILKADGPLAGKDLTNPADAAEVRQVLEAYASGKPATGAAEKIEAFLNRPEFQGVQDVARTVEQPSGAGVSVPSEPAAGITAGAAEQVEPSGVVPTGETAGDVTGGEGQRPRTLTERQQRIEFGKALGAAQSYPGSLQGRKNLPAQKAAVAGDFSAVVNALEKSKNATVAEVARRAKGLGTKIEINDEAGEYYEGRSALQDQMSIDGAKMHLEALNKLRELAPVVDQLPDGAPLPYDIGSTPITAIHNGQEMELPLRLRNIAENNNSMFSPLGLPGEPKLRTKEDFKALLDAFERTTQELGEDKLRLTSTASAIQQGVAGAYNPDTDTISVPEYFAKDEAVLAHEIVHAQVLQAVANPTKEQKPAVQRLNALYDHVKKVVDERAQADQYFRVPYGTASVQEFISEGLSNPDFQYLLSRIQYENTSVWDKFVETIANLLGLKNDNALTELLTVYSELTNKPAPAAQTKPAPAPKEPGKRAKKDIAKAEQGIAEAAKEQAQFVEEVDQNVNDLLTGRLRKMAHAEGVSDEDISSQDYRGSDVHNFLRVPALFTQYRDAENMLKESAGSPQEAKNRQQMAQIEEAIRAAGPESVEIFDRLRRMSPAQQDLTMSELNKIGLQQFDKDSGALIAKAKAEVAAQKREGEPTPKKLEGAALTKAKNEVAQRKLSNAASFVYNDILESDTAKEAFKKDFKQHGLAAIDRVMESLSPQNQEVLRNELNFIYGQQLFLPAYEGPTFNEADAELANKGDFNGLLRSMLNQIKDPAIKQVLRKLRSLNLNVKVVVAPVEGGKAGSYDPATNTITIDPTNGMNAHTFIHEAIHAAISNVLASPNHPLTKDFQKFFNQLQSRLGAAYGAQDLQEFAAELVGNPSFQAVLKSIKTPRSESMFRHILRSIAEFLGFMPKSSAFDTGLNFIDKALDLTSGVEATAAEKMFLGMGNFPALAQIGQAMPAMTRGTVDQARNIYSNLSDGGGFKQMAFGLLRLDNLRNMYGDKLPSIQTLLDALEKRTGTQERKIKEANTKYKQMAKVQKANPQAMKRLNDIAIDARVAGVDLLDPKFQPEPAQQAEYSRLKTQFASLPKAVQDVYRTIRGDYDASFNQYMDILKRAANSVSPSLATRLAQEFQTRKPLVGYVPFLRQGNFWVEYEDPQTGERAVSAFQSFRERQQFIDSMLKGKPHRIFQNIQDVRYAGDSLPPTHFIHQVINGLKQQGASDAQVDGVYQAYLATFPAESLMKQFMKSKNTAGMERDIVRGYGDLMIRYARKLSNSEYVPQIDRALRQVQNEAQNSGDPTLVAAAQNITDQAAFFHNPTYSNLVHTATALSYFEYIAGNISSALVNVTSLPMMVWPMLVGRHGWANASSAMTAAGKTAMNDWSKGKYKNLYNTLMDHAQLEHTMAREILEGRRQSTDDFVGLKGRILDGLSIPMSAAEQYNRAVTAIATYDLAKQSGLSEEKAIQQALNTVKDVHTSGLAATGPKWMQTPLGRMFFTFKSFIWNSAYVMARAFHQAFKSEDPQIRAAAQRQLLATYGMATVLAGVKGMPFYGAASVLASMINALFGDDEEPFDFDEFMRDVFGETLFKGFANKVLNLEIANRAGIATDLVFRDDPRGIAEHGYVLSALQQAFGPLGSIAVNSERAIKLFGEGNIERGVETLAPSFVRNFLKGTRYLVEGATTIKGDPIMEDIGAYNGLMQMVGFSPADLSSQYEKTQAAKGFEREVLKRRQNLLERYDMAVTAGDSDLLMDTMERITEFNSSRPSKTITRDTLVRSQRARAAAEKEMVAGVRFDKDLRQEIIEKFYDDED